MLRGGKEPCVFVVDDESLIADTLSLILRLAGFQARSFSAPIEALRSAREAAPDLLLTDVVMPLVSGIELAIQMLELFPHCKVLLFSGNPATVELLAGARASGHEFEVLAKPVHPADLLKRVHAEFGA